MPDVEVKRGLRRVWRLAHIVLAIGLLTVWTTDVLAQPGLEDGLIDDELDGGRLSYPKGDEYQEFDITQGDSLSIALCWDDIWEVPAKISISSWSRIQARLRHKSSVWAAEIGSRAAGPPRVPALLLRTWQA